MTAEPWVSVEGIARHLGETKDSIYRWIEDRGLPSRRVGRLWEFKREEVDEWVPADKAPGRGPDADGGEGTE